MGEKEGMAMRKHREPVIEETYNVVSLVRALGMEPVMAVPEIFLKAAEKQELAMIARRRSQKKADVQRDERGQIAWNGAPYSGIEQISGENLACVSIWRHR